MLLGLSDVFHTVHSADNGKGIILDLISPLINKAVEDSGISDADQLYAITFFFAMDRKIDLTPFVFTQPPKLSMRF